MSLDIALLRKAVEWAETEDARKKRVRKGAKYFMAKGEHTWLQKLWAQIRPNQKTLDEGQEVYSNLHGNPLLAVDPMSCGSTGCIAGHICVLAGDRYAVSTMLTPSSEPYTVQWVVTPENKVVSIDTRAVELLGVDTGSLFAGGNTIQEVRLIAEQLARDNGEVL